MIKELGDFYIKNGISSLHFSCKNELKCRENAPDFTGPKAAFVGRHYHSEYLPKLLFVSLDSGSAEQDPHKRSLEEVRRWEEDECHHYLENDKNKHWYRTHELAQILLSEFDQTITIQNSHDYFAHTNSAKCCQNKEGRRMADHTLFLNCREFLSEEIKILKPDILVTQGKQAKIGVESSFECKIYGDQNQCGYAVLQIQNKKALWLHTYHPRFFGGFNRQRRECYNFWRNLSNDFITNSDVELFSLK